MQIPKEKHARHGMSRTPEHKAWAAMLDRCRNPKNPSYHNYGGRGIKVCTRWQDSFGNFLSDMGRKPSPKYSIERRNNSRGYTPANCAWVTSKEQTNNMRTNRRFSYQGVSLTLAQWSDTTGIPYFTLYSRLVDMGWSVADTFTRPVEKKGILLSMNGKTLSVVEWSRLLGIKERTIYSRVSKGFQVERCLRTGRLERFL